MQTFSSSPAPTDTNKIVHWHSCSLALSCCCEHKIVYVHIHDTQSQEDTDSKRYSGFDSFSAEAWQLLQAALSFSKNVKQTVQGRLFSFHWLHYFLSLFNVFRPPSNYLFLVFFLCLVWAVVLPSLLSTMTTMLPLGHHLPFILRFFLFPSEHSLGHAAAQLCQTNVVTPKHP